MRVINVRRVGVAALGGALAVSLAACGSSSNSSGTPSGPSTGAAGGWASAQSLAAGGGMDALVKAAKAEGTLNTITLDPTWANYGKIMAAFTAKYGIKIVNADPTGGSKDEVDAIVAQKGQSSAPDVVDIGNSYALSAAQQGLWAPYKVQTWNDIPAANKDSGGLWYASYTGYVSIGCDASKLHGVACPKTFKELDNPAFKGMVALNDSPTSANAAFLAVWAAALAHGGSATNIQPGIDFFKKLNDEGIFNKAKGDQSTIENGSSPIVVDWDFLNKVHGKNVADWKVAVPSDGLLSAYYDQAISASAPHPAAARLWEEFLYSHAADGGQNGWLAGYARPVELAAMIADKSAVGAQNLPVVNDPNPFLPTQDQIQAQKAIVNAKWAAEVH